MVRWQANRAGFTVVIKRSCVIRNPMLELVCERSSEHKVPKKKLKHVATGSRKCECLFKVRGYVVKEENARKLAILNGVHNHEMLPYLEGHLLAERLMDDNKKIVHDLTKSSAKWKNILTNLKRKRQWLSTSPWESKKFKSKPKITSTNRIPSWWETIDSQFRIVNLHQKSLHNLKEKVLALEFLHVPRF